MEVDYAESVLCKTCFPIFIFVFFNFELAILIAAGHHFPFFSKTEQTLNVTTKTKGYGNYVHRCKQSTLNESSKPCVDEDYPLRRFVEFGLFERFIPIGLYCLMYLLICRKATHRRVRKHLRWMLLIILILFLAGDLIQLTAYLVYAIYVGSELNFNHRNWRWGYILGLSNIAVCVTLEWTYMLVRTRKAIQKRRKGIAVNTDRLYCWSFSSFCLKDPDELCAESPNYSLYTYQNVLVHRWLKEDLPLQTDKNIADVVKLFSYLHKSQKPKDEEAEIWKIELNILAVEEIGNSNVLNAYQNRKEILVKNQEGIHHNIIPFEKFRKGIKPVDTANWIHQLLTEDAHLRQAVDRNLNEFYLFHYIKREHLPALKENGFEMSNFTSAGAGSAIHFRENSNEHIFFNQAALVENNRQKKKMAKQLSFTPTSGDVYFATPKQVLVTKDPVFVRKDVVNGHYIGQKPPNYMLLAILMCVINPICGPVALIFAIMSDRAYYAADIRYAEKWGEYAFTACIIIFIATVVLAIAIGFSLSPYGVKGGHSY